MPRGGSKLRGGVSGAGGSLWAGSARVRWGFIWIIMGVLSACIRIACSVRSNCQTVNAKPVKNAHRG